MARNVRRGHELLTGERQKVDKWLRRFLISSYQSYLCNRYLVRRLEIGAFDRLLAGDVAKKYATGGMFDVSDLDAETAALRGTGDQLHGAALWSQDVGRAGRSGRVGSERSGRIAGDVWRAWLGPMSKARGAWAGSWCPICRWRWMEIRWLHIHVAEGRLCHHRPA